MYNVFCDFHHASLLQSLILLFEKRLGGYVYRPIGMEWAQKGFWKVYDHPATQLQYLGIGGATPDGTPPLNEVVAQSATHNFVETSGVYLCKDIDSDWVNKAITFDAFMALPIDIVIATLPQHIEPFAKLCELHPNKPKLIYQVGNAWNYDGNAPVKNIMASARMAGMTIGLNTIEYHQEFDTNIFTPFSKTEPHWHDGLYMQNDFVTAEQSLGMNTQKIYSFVNCFSIDGIFAADYKMFLDIERAMPEWTFKAYGGQCRDGAVGPAAVVAQKMREAMFIWHTKVGGDGYGHVIHNAPAVARPLIVKKQYYDGKMAEPLLIDGETCIAIDGLDYPQIINKITHYAQPEQYKTMSAAAYANFKRVVDFDREAESIKQFLANLI